MSAREVLVRLPRRVRVWAEGDGLHYQAPKGTMTPDLRGTIQRHKPSLLRLMGRAEDAQCCLEVQVPGLGDTLWFVPTDHDVDRLVAEGISRGRVWTAKELRTLITAPRLAHEDALSIARTKLAFDATVEGPLVDRRPASPELPDEPKDEQQNLDLGSPCTREFD